MKIDPSQLVVTSSLTTADAVRQLVAVAGVPVRAVRPLLSAPRHWLLELSGDVSSDRVRSLAQQLRGASGIDYVGHTYSSWNGETHSIFLDHVIVEFKDEASPAQIDSINSSLGLRILRVPRADSAFHGYWLQYPRSSSSDPLTIAATLDRHPLVDWADPNQITDARPHRVPTDPFYGSQFHLRNPLMHLGVRVDINAEPAWDLTLGSSSILVAVIDDGLDFQQLDLNLPFNGNGIDQFYPCPYPDCVPGEGAYTPVGNDTHGTSVSGIIAATHDNARGGAGVAPGVVISIARIFREYYPPHGPSCPIGCAVSVAKQADAINWAWEIQHADVINNSWGGGAQSNAVAAAVAEAISLGRNGKGTAVVFSAGNNARNDYEISRPLTWQASLPNVVSVGSIDRYGSVADYSNSGSTLTIVAPSGHYTYFCTGEVVTTDLWGSRGCNGGPSGDVNFTQSFSGTSASAPQVSGVIALLLSREPNLTVSQIRSRLIGGADPWGGSPYYGAGKLNAYRTLVPAGPPPPPPPSFAVSVSEPANIRAGATCTWFANTVGGTAPYSFSWTVNGVPVGDASAALTYTAGTTPFTIDVWATDATNLTVSGSRTVNIDPAAPVCDL